MRNKLRNERNKRRNKRKHSQLFSLDILIAMLAFTSILVSSIIAWDYSIRAIELKEKKNELEMSAITIMSLLIETTGAPENWSKIPSELFNKSNVLSIGLAKNSSLALSKGSWELSKEKVYYLNSSNYNKTKKILGLVHNFNLTLKLYNGTDYVFNYSVSGIANASEVVRVNRYAIFENKRAELVLMIVMDK